MRMATRQPPDLVVLDLGLPDIDGQEVLRQLREWLQAPIVILSARDQEQQKVAALDSGADDYVAKPFHTGELLARLPFMEVTGTVTYNREATLPAAGFYDPGDTWTEATPTFTQVTASLKIMGGDADVDNFLQSTYADPNDIEAEVIANRSKAIANAVSTPAWTTT